MSGPQPDEIDPVTGYSLTGHNWNGIRELNTPLPKIVLWALALTFLYSVISWVLLPAWPLGRDYTRGLLGLDQGEMAVERFKDISQERVNWLPRFATGDFAALQSDAELMKTALPAAGRLFADNCAACHGAAGQGGPGFPDLVDGYWLWGGAPQDIAQTIRVGINSEHPETRFAQMPNFEWMERPDRVALAEYVVGLHEGTADAESPAAKLFADNCVSCHGEGGQGGVADVGAPSLVDTSVIYGQDSRSVMETIWRGRQGTMPAWTERLSEAEINLLALYVVHLGQTAEDGAQ